MVGLLFAEAHMGMELLFFTTNGGGFREGI
jgi:hypothetical protein